MGVSRSVKLKANDGLVYQFTNEKLSASSEGVQTFNHTTHAYNLVKMFEHLYIGIASRDLLAVVDLVDSRLSSRARLQPEPHKSEVLQFLGTALQRGILHCRAIPETKPVIIHTELPSVPLIVSSGTTLPKGGAEAPITPSEDQIRVDTPAVAIKETEFCGDPVSMVSGEEILTIDDASLSGAQPITWGRMYRSGQCQFDVGMGYGWRSQYQYEFVLLEPEDQPEVWRFIDNEGCILYFDVIAKGAVSYQLRAGASLYHHPKGYYLLRLSDGRQLRFSWRYEGWRLDKLRIDQTTQYGFRYSSAGRMIGIETNGFLRLLLRYDASGHLVTVEMPSKEDDSLVNVIASYHYNADGQLVAATNRHKQTEHYQYRDDHLLTCRQRASGFSHYFEWLGGGSMAKCRAQWGDNHCYQYQFDYDNSASSTISTDSRGHQWHYYHNEQGLLVKKISPAGATWRYEYNQLGLKVAGIDPNGSVTRYDYNAQGLLCALHAPSGAITRYCYNRFGQLTEQCSPLGHITTHRFNSLGLLLETRHPKGNEDHYEYDHQGRLIQHVAADGQCYRYWWNAEGLLTAFKQNHAVTRYSYDAYGEINGLANPDGSIIEYQRDSAGNIAQTRHYHPDHETPAVEQSYTYDDAGRLISHADPIGRISHIVWGGLSQPEKIIQPDGSYIAYQYDQERNLTGITRSDGCNYQLEWDAEERVSRTIGFDGRDQHYAYDANSQLIAVREGDRTVHLVRDTAGRVIEKQTVAESGARDSQLYDYDVIGRLLNANTTARKLRFEWQGSKQLSTTWQDAWQLQYEYDEQGNRTQLILPDGQCLGYQYDSQQQLSAITLNGADVLKVKRDKLGRELKRQQVNGITQQCDFDNHGRLQQQKWTSEHDNSHRRQYHYDSASQLIAIQDNALGRQQFSYDSLNQLQAHHQNNTTTNYQFDSFGNPRLGNPDFEECESTNDRLQRYQSKIFDYDKCGNQATVRDEDSGQHRQFNGFNQLTQLSHNGRYSHYDYDALGRRSRKTTEQHTVDFLWDGDQLIGEHSQGQYRWYIYAPNDFTPLALIDNGALYYYHTDHLGTPHTVTDSEGDVVWQATYNALGCAFISVDIIHNPLRFQGQYHDQESSLHYNRFRYYDPSIGQFIHQDPIGLLGGINHYRYAPNPIQWVDPLGLSCKEGKISPLVGPRASHTSYPLYPVSPDVMVESKAYGYGLVEVFAAGAYNSGIDVAAGLAGLATLATGGSLNDSAELIEKVQSNYGYTPSSEGAQMLAQDLAPYLNEYEQTMSAAGDYVLDATGSPLAATLTHKSFEVAGTIAGGKMLLNSVKRSVVKSNSKLFNGVIVDDIKLAKSKGASLEHIQARKNVTLDYMNENGFTKDQIFDALGSPDGSKDGGFDLTQPVEVMTFPPPDSMSQYVASHGYPGNWFDPLSNQRPDLLGISGEGRTLKHFKVVQGTGLKSTAKPVIDTWTTPEKPLFTNGGGIQLLVNDRVKSAISEINSIGI